MKVSEDTFKSFSAVFGNDLVLTEILKYLIFNKDEKSSQEMVQSVRLVQKRWLKTSTFLLKKSWKPFIVLNLDETNSLNESEQVKKHGKRLDQFASIFSSVNRLENSFLPFKLDLTLEYFRQENHQSLSDCLKSLGNELIEFHVTFPEDGGSMSFTFPQFKLPVLKRLNFEFSNKKQEKRVGDMDSFGDNTNSLSFLQLILHASSSIQTFRIPWIAHTSDTTPDNFDTLQLPTSLSSLNWCVPMPSEKLEVLLQNELPNLRHLELRLAEIDEISRCLIYQILHRFRKTLKSFYLDVGVDAQPNIRPIIIFTFPAMENLEILEIMGTNFEPDPEQVSSLSNFLPKLKRVHLLHQNERLIRKWIENTKLESVQSVHLLNSDCGPELEDTFCSQSLNIEIIAQMHLAFPNVTELYLSLHVADMSCLKYVFKNMLKLKALLLEFYGSVEEGNKYCFDSIFMGLPINYLKMLREDNIFRSFVLNQDNVVSILNLSELTSLNLTSAERVPVQGHIRDDDDPIPFISDLFFHEGLSKMPKLTKLNLGGKFQVSKKMEKLWREQNRLIVIPSRSYTADAMVVSVE